MYGLCIQFLEQGEMIFVFVICTMGVNLCLSHVLFPWKRADSLYSVF